MKDISKSDIRLELKSRRIVKKKLESAIKSLEKPISKLIADRKKRKDALMLYKSERDLQDAYGWGFITEEEYDSLLDKFHTGTDAIDAETSAQEIAKDILAGWLKTTLSDIASLEFDLLPEKKKTEIREENERILKEREERRREKGVIS